METDVIPDPCAIWRFTEGGLAAAKGGYHYVAFGLGNKVLTRRQEENNVDMNDETESQEAIIRGGLWGL